MIDVIASNKDVKICNNNLIISIGITCSNKQKYITL